MQYSIRLLPFFFFVLLFVSCGKKPGNILSEEQMVDVLTDVYIAKGIYYGNASLYDSEDKKNALMQGVFDKHKITQAELDTSLTWYSKDIGTYISISDSVTSRLRSKSDFYNNEWNAASAISGKVFDIMPPSVFLDFNSPTMRFNIDSIKLKTIDLSSFHFAFDVQGLAPKVELVSNVYFKYKDTTVYTKLLVDSNASYRIEKPSLPDSSLINISGYIHRKFKPGSNLLPPVLIHNIAYKDTTLVKMDSNSVEGETDRLHNKSFLESKGQPIEPDRPKSMESSGR